MTGSDARPRAAASSRVILCADDFAISEGVSQAILELAVRNRISATSALVTFERWPQDARRLAAVRDHIAVGLHLNLTLGKPLGPMPSLAPDGELPTIGALVGRALTRRLEPGEIAAEVTRQLARFEAEIGFAPDHVDGHQHAHALPAVRQAVLAALADRFPCGGPLLRDPVDWLGGFRGGASGGAKAVVIALLSAGFRSAARKRGFLTNTTFAGVSSFDSRRPYALELAAALRRGGACHLVMCHPGYADAELSRVDPVVQRREEELAALMEEMSAPAVPLWRPSRAADGPAVAWAPG